MVYILLAPGFEEVEALAPADLLRRAGIETALVSLDGAPVPGSHSITVTADITLDEVDLDKADMVVLPGGGPGYKNLGKDPRVEELVRKAVKRDLWVAAICAAPSWASGACWRGSRPSATPAWRRAWWAPFRPSWATWRGMAGSSLAGPPGTPTTSLRS